MARNLLYIYEKEFFYGNVVNGNEEMSKREALKILMLSPFYYRFSLKDRKALLNEFYMNHCLIN